MHRNAKRVQEALQAAGLETEVVDVPAGTRTAQEAADALETTVGQIAKSIVFTQGDSGVVVVASGTNRVSEAKVSALTEAPVGRADADAVRRLTGFPIGGVPPLAHSTDVTVLIDEDLMGFDEVWAAAGTPNAVFRTTGKELHEATGAKVADIKA
jgi:prolyl-tRNA editing enzyme YbaK/EbsC (Cys-tRNA(Pro) deacylase)